MDIDKRTIIGIVLIVLVLILVNTPVYKKTFFPKQYAQEQMRREAAQRGAASSQERPEMEDREEIRPARAEAEARAQAEESGAQEMSVETGEGEVVRVKTLLYAIELSTRGATIISCKFNNFPNPDGDPVQIIGGDGEGNLAIGFSATGDSVDTAQMIFEVDKRSLTLREQGESQSITFTLKLSPEKMITKTFVFHADRYSFDLVLNLKNMHDMIEKRQYTLTWKSGLAPAEQRLIDDLQESKVYAYVGANLEKFDLGRASIRQESPPQGDVHWVGTRIKYFASVLIPKTKPGVGVDFFGRRRLPQQSYEIWDKFRIEEKDRQWKQYAFNLNMGFLEERERSDSFTVYIGPLDYDVVRSEQVRLEQMMSLGWKVIRPFSKAVLWSLKSLRSVIPNYGWVIVIFSIIVKIILYPLTHKSYQSMHKMQELQPKLTALKEKYGKDPQKLNQETMKLYKEQGVNPMGGCLPMLLQMPLLYALFITFRNTVALRGEPFILWIKDLANPDTIAVLPFTIPMYGNLLNVLPLLMGVTMLMQQKMSMKDPKQKMMVYFMPIFFTLLFNSFPSGLNLYYMLFNLFSIVQQKFVTDRLQEGGTTQVKTTSKKKR